ncbi:endonuclease/exonuclease/phosphatase family protein [Streptomyces griseosporeus]|uniref:fascin domain-containing protein n=1 Tax=Streptomyces griseosporeus TaxID=1910 RepID=UPI0036FBAAFB
MKRIRIVMMTLAMLVAGSVGLLAPGSATAADAPRSSTGQRWALQITDGVTGKSYYVAAELSDTLSSDQKGRLRARTAATSPTAIGTWETFTLHTADNGATVSLRNEENGLYVSTEVNYATPYTKMLRARAQSIGTSSTAWEKFQLQKDTEVAGAYNLKSMATQQFVSARFNLTSPGDQGLLLAAYGSASGSWERIRLVPVPNSGQYGDTADPPATANSPAGTTKNVVSWNACSNNNPDCALDNAEVTTVGDTVAQQAAAADADVVFVQEICEKSAAALENSLEGRRVGGLTDWDVRFAPTYRKLTGTDVLAQKHCANSKSGADRGAYGMAVAVPSENTWYRSWILPSRDTAEQRPLMCATVPTLGTAFCGGHFSAGIAGDDVTDTDNPHPTGYYRNEQAKTAFQQASTLGGLGYEVVFGGDLNATPPDAPQGTGSAPAWVLEPLYHQPGVVDDRFEECDQSAYGGSRTGTPTHVSTSSSLKLDYIFGPQSADYSCSITDTGVSDHKLIHAAVSFH